jgi:hypothetical protein
MRNKVVILSIVIPLIAIFSAGIGYTIAFVQGLVKANDMNVRAHCDILLTDSLRLSRSSDINDCIDKVELNYSDTASYILANEPFISADSKTKRRIPEALKAWEKAQAKLQELKSVYIEEQKRSNKTDK